MSNLIAIAVIIALFSLFGILHSITASFDLKEKIAVKFPKFMPYYRAVFNLFSIITFYLVYELSPKPYGMIYDLKPPFDLFVYFFQLLWLAGIVYSVRYFDLSEFLGVNQIKRGLKGTYRLNSLDEETSFRIDGPYRFSRHPLYLFSILFLGFRPYMDIFYLTAFLCLTAYFIVGGYFEEKSLVKKFGEPYLEYQKNVSMIFPFKLFSKNV